MDGLLCVCLIRENKAQWLYVLRKMKDNRFCYNNLYAFEVP